MPSPGRKARPRGTPQALADSGRVGGSDDAPRLDPPSSTSPQYQYKGETALQLAAKQGDLQAVGLLLQAGARVDLWDFLALKAEYLSNRELAGAPLVDNDVFTSSAVFTW